jgi:hypothetical protein
MRHSYKVLLPIRTSGTVTDCTELYMGLYIFFNKDMGLYMCTHNQLPDMELGKIALSIQRRFHFHLEIFLPLLYHFIQKLAVLEFFSLFSDHTEQIRTMLT